MSLMRKALLAGSTSPWLREQATKRAFIRKSVSKFMPGETIDEALAAAKALQPERITTILTRLGENLVRIVVMRSGCRVLAASSASSIVSPGMNLETDFRMNARLVACSRSHGDVDPASSAFRIKDMRCLPRFVKRQ